MNMQLTVADATAVDRVCGAMPCVVLVVAGRPMVLSDRLPQMDALVASWLPGSEGAGVADVLFGDVPFTGRLPFSWPRTLAQEPINVGDAVYDPEFAFGWGLRTDSPSSRAEQARDALEALADPYAAAAAGALAQVSDASALGRIVAARAAAMYLDRTAAEPYWVDDVVASLARDVAQDRGGRASLTADAEHELLIGNVSGAVEKLAEAAGVTLADGAVGGTVAPTLSLTLGPAASFGAFTPGVGRDYTASTTANVISTAGDAALSVADPSGSGRLVNGAFSLAQPLRVAATSAAGASAGTAAVGGLPALLATYGGPVSNDAVTLSFTQTIGVNEPLRSGVYAKTLTFTLSTTSP
jgi:beta-glucosidase